MLLAGWLSDKIFKSKAHRTCFFCIVFATLSFFLFWKSSSLVMSFIFLVMSAFFIYGPQALYGVCASQQSTKYAAGTSNGKDRFLSSETVLKAVPELEEIETDGVASVFRVPGYTGTVGLIHPITGKFCDRCDRVRLTSDGKLKPCLHSPLEFPLRGLEGDDLMKAFREAIWGKPKEHSVDPLHPSGAGRGMYEIGG